MLPAISRNSIGIIAWVILTITCSCASSNPELFPEDPESRTIAVQVISHGWHVGIVVPLNDDFYEIMPAALHLSPDSIRHTGSEPSRFAELGWGDRAYYTTDNPGIWTTIKGGIWPTPSTIHLVGISQPASERFSQLEQVEIYITVEGYRALLERASSYFTLNEENEAMQLQSGLYGNSRFYKSNRSYFVPRTSNRWVAELLKEAGLPVRVWTSIRASHVMRQLKRVKREYPDS
ncbi:MAG: DUF2459 domain-containing protein [Balneolales bacterium]|nr:DUF2459 domain-containing protein [Balneolales bacterium]